MLSNEEVSLGVSGLGDLVLLCKINFLHPIKLKKNALMA